MTVNMDEEQLQVWVENGEWKSRAIKILQQNTRSTTDLIIAFVESFWQLNASDEDNIIDFELYESEYLEICNYS